MQNETQEFTLMTGGPLHQFYLWLMLGKQPLVLYKRRIIFICLFAWLPLLIISWIAGVTFGGVQLPFLADLDVHARFLVSLPLLIFAEFIANNRLQVLVRQFTKCNLIATDDKPRFDAIIASAMRLTRSPVVELALLLFVIIGGRWISHRILPFVASTWYLTEINGVTKLTTPGYWYAFISLPLFQFILLRWYYRISIWYRFLWQVSRLKLRLNSLHPDRTGGIGFLTNSIYAFEPFLLAHSFLLAGMIYNRVWNVGASLSQFQGELIGTMVFLILLPVIPLMFFMRSLVQTMRVGTLEYDVVANQYVQDFRKKWIEQPSTPNELLGTSDIQSLADLSNSYTVSCKMRAIPLSQRSILLIVILTALPLAPLIFTVIPVDKIFHQVVGLIF